MKERFDTVNRESIEAAIRAGDLEQEVTYLSTPTGVLQIPIVQPDGKLATLHPTAAYPIFTTPGTSNTITITAKDAAGNVLTGYTGTVTITTSDLAATLSHKSYTFTAADLGTKTFTVGSAPSASTSCRSPTTTPASC